jgi:hypothetical protein
MLKWLRGGNASQRVGVIESVQLDGKRSIKFVRRDNIEHLVLVGSRTDVVIEPNIVRRPAPKPAHRPASETRGLPPPGVPTREPPAGSPPKSRQHDLGELTRRLEAELRGSPPLRATRRRCEPKRNPSRNPKLTCRSSQMARTQCRTTALRRPLRLKRIIDRSPLPATLVCRGIGRLLCGVQVFMQQNQRV